MRHQAWSRQRPAVTVAVTMLLAACSTLRTAPAPAPPEVPATLAVDTPPADETSAPVEPPGDAQQVANETALPPCTPVPKVKPKPKPKPRLVRKEAPLQPQTAPIVADTPTNAVIDAQVKPISMSVMSILGKKVRGPKDEDLGRVVDVLADTTGRVRVAIIDFGGFLGVGNHRIAVDWPLLRFNPDSSEPSLLLNVSREKLQSAPEYKEALHPQMLMVPAPPPVPAQ